MTQAQPLAPAYFVTGTDTEIGKTHASCCLLAAAARCGLRAAGMKPVAAGCEWLGGRWCNEDVERLLAASSLRLAPEVVNPYLFRAAIAPHIAAAQEGRSIEFSPILQALAQMRAAAEFVVVEGVGGFRVPLGAAGDSADLAVALGLPVILVVGMRLGCINHALLSLEAIAARGLACAGWIANRIDPAMPVYRENIAALTERLDAPLIAELPHANERIAARPQLETWIRAQLDPPRM
ncbi:MAG: dethiobiotin synthase [Rhodocyclaceae bacterium]|nr:dethiobiotin synthase [Rhodocyclaceae bacterium]